MSDAFAYVGTYTQENGSSLKRNACANGLGVYRISENDERSWAFVEESPVISPCVFEINGNSLFCLSADTNAVTWFHIDPCSGSLKEHQKKEITYAKKLAVVTSTHAMDRILAADFEGNIYVLNIVDGYLDDVCTIEPLQGEVGPLKSKWQPCSRPHHIIISKDDRFVYIADKGFDRIHAYELTKAPESKLKLLGQVCVRRAGCPRHLVLSPDGKRLYCNLEFGNAVVVCELQDGVPEAIQMVNTLPDTCVDTTTKTAEIKMHPSGKWLYVSNRGNDSIAVFDIDQETGFLKSKQYISCGGEIPRSMEIDPSGRRLFSCNQFSNKIEPFEINKWTGELTPLSYTIDTPCPVWLRFTSDCPNTIHKHRSVEGIT